MAAPVRNKTTGPPRWDTVRERWTVTVQHRDELGQLLAVEHIEVGHPDTGTFRQPPEGVDTKPKPRSRRRR